jgi:hypothetical protein
MRRSSPGLSCKREGPGASFVGDLAFVHCHGVSRRFQIGGEGEQETDRASDLGEIYSVCTTNGLISEPEAQFLIEEYLRDFRSKNGWDGKTYINPMIF